MSEVKVRITAQNQTQTGFQSVLSDAKRVSAQVKQTFSQASAPSGPGAAGGSVLFGPNMTVDDWVAQAERNIEENLKKRKALRESMREASTGGSETGGAPVALGSGLLRLGGIITGAISTGLYLKGRIEQIAKAFEAVTDNAEKFAMSLSSIGQSTSISELVSGLKSANSQFEAIQQQAKDFKSELPNNIANALSFGALFRSMDEQVESAGRLKGLNAELALARQLRDLREETATIQIGGDVEGMRRQQQTDRMREALRMGLEGNSPRFIERQLGRFDQVMAAQEELRQAQRDQDRQKENEEKAKRQSRIDQDIRIKKAKATGDEKTLQEELLRQDVTAALESGATLGQAKDLAAIEAAMRAQQQLEAGSFKGTQGASAFQRIGFASNEFFDTRSNEKQSFSNLYKEMQKAAASVLRIEKKVKDGDLVLSASSG